MIEPFFSFKSELCADVFVFLQNTIFAFDAARETYFIANIQGAITQKTKLNIAKNGIRAIALCKTLPLFAYIDEGETSAIVVDAQGFKPIRSFRLQDTKIESVGISDLGDTILLGGKNGLLSCWQIHTGQLLSNPSHHNDSIAMALESADRRFIVSVGLDRSVFLYDKQRDKKHAHKITTANAKIKSARFCANDTLLVFADASGYIFVVNLITGHILHRFQLSSADLGGTELTKIDFYKEPYIFYLTENGTIGVVDYSLETSIVSDFMPEKHYKNFAIADDFVVLVSEEGDFDAYSFGDFIKKGEQFLEKGDVAAALRFVLKHSFLKNEDFAMLAEAAFEADVLEARMLACSDKIPLALKILKQYSALQSKAQKINELIAQINGIEGFLIAMQNNQEAKAIAMAATNPILRDLKVYVDYEMRFQKILFLAKELAKRGKKIEANTIMAPYKKIPSKIRAVQEVIFYPLKVDEALNAIRDRDYKTFLQLKRKYAFVAFLPKAREILDGAKLHRHRLLEAFYLMRFGECEEHIAVLNNFKDYGEEIADISFRIEEAKRFMDLFALSAKDGINKSLIAGIRKDESEELSLAFCPIDSAPLHKLEEGGAANAAGESSANPPAANLSAGGATPGAISAGATSIGGLPAVGDSAGGAANVGVSAAAAFAKSAAAGGGGDSAVVANTKDASAGFAAGTSPVLKSKQPESGGAASVGANLGVDISAIPTGFSTGVSAGGDVMGGGARVIKSKDDVFSAQLPSDFDDISKPLPR